MPLQDKIDAAKDYINFVLPHYKRPAIMCSFGKDSMVMLNLLAAMGHKLPVVFYTDPWFPEKYEWARQIISTYGLEVYDYPPSAITLLHGKEIVAFTNYYQIGHGYLELPKNIEHYALGKRWVCGLQLLQRPTGTFNYPWDAVFVGHKDSDVDQIAGSVKLNVDVKMNAGRGPDLLFPLKSWTDEDIWEYTDAYDVPQQWDRYDRVKRTEKPDKWTNSDYANVCINCCDCRVKEASVPCPKLGGMMVPNVTALVPYKALTGGYYGDAGADSNKG